MDILNYNYQQERSFDALEAAAGNTGSTGSVLGAGIGLGMGVGMGPAMGASMGQAAQQMNITKILCSACRTPNSADAAFCCSCGVSMRPPAVNMVTCPKCAKQTHADAFCSHCGSPTVNKCTKCTTVIPAGAKFCPGCGASANS